MRRTKLVDCNPRWVSGRYAGRDDDVPVGLHFDCPEGHEGCDHAVPFTPALDGSAATSWQSNGCQWQRTGDTFETLTLTPSILTPQRASGCAFHGFIRDGAIEFCGDYDGGEDLELGRMRQTVLLSLDARAGVAAPLLVVDGVCGPASLAAMKRHGFARWRDV